MFRKIFKFTKKFHKELGFTLVELLITLGIIAMIVSMSAFRGGATKRDLAVQLSAQTIVQTVNEAINYSLGGKEHGGTVSEGGYAVSFSKASGSYDLITLYADCNRNGVYTSSGGAASCEAAADSGTYPELVRQIKLEKGVRITRLTRTTNAGSVIVCPGDSCTFFAVFRPPDPIVQFYRIDGGPPNPMSGLENILIDLSYVNRTATVVINSFGGTQIR